MTLSTDAYELGFEYGSFSEDQFLRSESPERMDSEYHSDLVAYRESFSEVISMMKSQNRFFWNIGSLSSENFYSQRYVDLNFNLSNHWSFRSLYLQLNDFETSKENFIVELSYLLSEKWRLGGFGDAGFDKAKDDLGVFLSYYLSSSYEMRLSHEFIDFDRNKRNLQDDYWLSSAPQVSALSLIPNWPVIKEGDLVLYSSLRIESPSERYFENSSTRVSYQSWSWQLRVSQPWKNFDLEMDHQTDYIKRKRSDLTNSVQQKVLKTQTEIYLSSHSLFKRGTLTLGVAHFFRKDEQNTSKAHFNDVLPIAKLKYRTSSFWTSTFGLEGTFRNTRGEKSLLSEGGKKSSLQTRWNYWLSYHSTDHVLIRLGFSFDLDQFGSSKSWEGGSGLVRVGF